MNYKHKLPPKLDRRYIVTGGSGLVGGFIVLQLLARGNPPESIRIVDIRRSERNDMRDGPASEVEFVQTDITSPASVAAAFSRPWKPPLVHLPLTVFHTAAVILASDRSKYQYHFPELVNVTGTKNVLEAARNAGADIFSSTSSGSISIRPVDPWVAPWADSAKNFWQTLDEKDFSQPLRAQRDFFGNYPLSKAVAERKILPEPMGDIRHLKPGIFSITTHLVASDAEARKPVSEGGLGYIGVVTTLEGMALEVLEWNEEHVADAKTRKAYTTSISLADQIKKLAPSSATVGHAINSVK
ncbi:putative 3-beta hydroxysteroid dehydrogenase isomerase protein [Eutypa lata UCREL1]|uniref:Putative 3-beta hydroxysteroid dehydrogenase isomerase protein n=1 Tax=Eutypa lata (strain UCR-EL1) TaxID=1287681 RepID=M7STJ2_EUTLA|nr:putative 3-beta hydroxysteroid dehydrogenase isomerase protein [Eutypa lata UCREL1]